MPRNRSIDLLKILGALAVILNHSLYPLYSRADFFMGKSWWVANFVYSASVVAVPLFIIINGLLLLPKKESLKKTYFRIWHRLLIPLFFWFGFYLFWRTKFYLHHYTFGEILGVIFSGSMFYYYFLAIIIGLQLLLPIWRLIISSGNKQLIKLVGVGTVIISLMSYIIRYSGVVEGAGITLVSWWLPFIAYYWWGYWRKHFHLPATKYWLAATTSIYLLIIYLSFIGIKMATINYSLLRENGIFYWHSLVSLPVFIISICGFEAIMQSKTIRKLITKKWISKIIDVLSPLTYGVYLSHVFVIEWVDIKYGFAIEFIQNNTQSFLITRTLLVILLSFLVSYILTKIPLINKTVGVSRRAHFK